MSDERRAWSLRIDEAQTLDALAALEPSFPPELASWLRIKLVMRRKALKSRAGTPQGEAFAAAYGLPAPDGRRLHGYRLTDTAFERLAQDIAAKGGYAGLEHGHGPALFVLWASEWFRRCYAGGGVRWAVLVQAIGLPEDQGRLRTITARGLRLWHRQVIRTSAREYLSSLAREGGFPAAAVREGAKGWANEVLQAIVSPLLGEPAAGEERAYQLAEEQRERLPQVFRDDDFVHLCADLALAIVAIRREVEPLAVAAGIPLVAWLGLNRPDWRDRLPLTTGDRVADALIDGLMQVEAVSGAAVQVVRLLAKGSHGDWQEAARIALSGMVDSATMRGVDRGEGRLRAFAASALARHLPGELALFEPPVDGGQHWEARPNQRSRGVHPVPFAAAIELDLRAGERRVARIALGGGKPRRGSLLVAVLDEGTEEAPGLLRIVGSGSGLYRDQVVFVQAPSGWNFATTEGETAELLGKGAGDTSLWRIRGGVVVTDAWGDDYRIRCGQSADQTHRIDLIGQSVTWAEVSGDVDLYAGPPLLPPTPDGSQLYLRAIGTRQWSRAHGTLPLGHYEVGLRRERTLLDRRRIAVVPREAALRVAGMGDQVRYALEGFGPVSLIPSADAPVLPLADGEGWRVRSGGAMLHHFTARLAWPDAQPLEVVIGFPCPAGIARWDGSLIPGGQRLTLDDLPDLIAVDRGEMQMFAELREQRGGKTAEMSWTFSETLPLGSVAGDIASLLLPASIDASVRLGMHDGIETYWHVDPFPLKLQRDGNGGFVASKGVVDDGAMLVGRCFADPAREVEFGPYSLLTEANHRPALLPDDLGGTWLVYLRSEERILSRPDYYRGPGTAPVATSHLARVMTLPPGPVLDEALHAVLSQAAGEGDDAAAIVEELIALTVSLRGLLPATFRVFSLLCEYPAVLARMAFRASADAREAVMALSDALPFAWPLVPRSCWDSERSAAFARGLELLGQLPDAPRFAVEMVATVSRALCARIPLLQPVLDPGPADPIDEVTQRFVNRAIERIRGHSTGRYRSRLGARLPAYFVGRFDERLLDTFDAPCAAALAVAGEWVPDAGDVRHLKTMARTYPTYFAEAFAACLKEHADRV